MAAVPNSSTHFTGERMLHDSSSICAYDEGSWGHVPGGGGWTTVITEVPCLPPAAAMIVVLPGDCAVTTPAWFTVPTVATEEDQLTVSCSVSPAASKTAAPSWNTW